MDHLIGQRFSLISKSEIRYVGILHEINPEASTIALQDVYSFGTEDRKTGADFIPASQHKFDYIVFRGSDVKDIKVADDQKENRQPEQPSIPNDPAILNSSRPQPTAQAQTQSHPNPPSQTFPPQQQQYPGFYGSYGYGGPPGNFRPGPGFPPYGPPPGGAPPSGPLPGGPPGWFNAPPNPFPQPPVGFGPGGHGTQFGPPGQRGPPGHQDEQSFSQQKTTSELPVDNSAQPKATTPKPPAPAAPTPPVNSKPTMAEALAAAPGTKSSRSEAVKLPPVNAQKTAFTPALPAMPIQKALNQTNSHGSVAKGATNVSVPNPSVASNSAAMAEATRQATAAVAAAMAKLPQATSVSKAPITSNAVDQLAEKISQMRPTEASAPRGRGRGRGRGSYNQQSRKVEVPTDDYDFETANAKFNKEDLIKEAIATGSPLGEGVSGNGTNGVADVPSSNGVERKDSTTSGVSAQAYNRSTSFFDNISSELKDREDANTARSDGRPGRRGEEIKKNIETFGQGSVDGGFRGGYRGRSRGRGYGRGAPRGYGGTRSSSGYRGRGRGGVDAATAGPTQS